MCYDIKYMTKKQIEYAKRYGADANEIKDLEEQLRILEPIKQVFHTTGFMHWKLPVIVQNDKKKFDFYQWGIIPKWTKSIKEGLIFSNKTLNARAETIFDKASFKSAIKKNRCLIIADGYYEHHHHKGKTYPFFIELKNKKPMSLAGIYEKWVDKETGEVFFTTAIITTKANSLMQKIHNNPKMKESRMPLILNKEDEMNWLKEYPENDLQNQLKKLIRSFDAKEMEAYTVNKLRGKSAVGNTPKAAEPFIYKELVFDAPENGGQLSLFG